MAVGKTDQMPQRHIMQQPIAADTGTYFGARNYRDLKQKALRRLA